MKIQKIVYLPREILESEIVTTINHDLPGNEKELFCKWPGINPVFTAARAASRDSGMHHAWLIYAEIDEHLFEMTLPGFSADDARFIFIGSVLEHGWETVPRDEDVAYLYGEYRDGDLKSVLKYDGKIRRYTMRNHLMPNINRRFTRFVILFPDLISFIEEGNSNFPRQCYVVSQVAARIAGSAADIHTIARLNNVPLNEMDDYIALMEKIAGKEIVLPQGRFQMEPLHWPILRV